MKALMFLHVGKIQKVVPVSSSLQYIGKILKVVPVSSSLQYAETLNTYR
jgi:hypothetical protein